MYDYCRNLSNALPAAVVRIMARFHNMDALAPFDSISCSLDNGLIYTQRQWGANKQSDHYILIKSHQDICSAVPLRRMPSTPASPPLFAFSRSILHRLFVSY